MKKYKVLLAGKGVSIVNDFFFHTDFECQNSSMRYEDICNHVKYFKPNAFVYCMRMEEKDDLVRLISLKPVFENNNVSFIIIGDRKEVDNFNSMAEDVADLTLKRPMSVTAMTDKIMRHFRMLEWEEVSEDYDMPPAPASPKLAKGPIASPKKQENVGAAKNPVQAAKSQVAKPQAAKPQATKPQATKPQVEEHPRRKHIVVIDDDPMTLKLVKGYLKEEYDVATAISGKLAMKFLENKTTDLIVLDYEMPGQNGPEVFRELKKLESTRRIPVVFLTGVDDITKVREVLALKPQGYLLKPIESEQLLSAIKGLIG